MPLTQSSRPGIRVRALLRWPAGLDDGSGITWAFANGRATANLDYPALVDQVSIADPSQYSVAVYDAAASGYKQVTLNNLPQSGNPFPRTSIGDAAYVVLTSDRYVGVGATLTAPRAVTLPLAANFPPGMALIVQDEAGGVTSTNTLTLTRSGSDTINGATTYVLNTAYAGVELRSNGTSKWSVIRIGSAALASDSVITAAVANDAVTNAKLANMAAATLKGSIAGGDPADLTTAQLRDNFLPTGARVDFQSATYTANTTLNILIPSDNTVPLSGEGTLIATVNLTPKTATNRLRARLTGVASADGANAMIVALFDGGGSAIKSSMVWATAAGYPAHIGLEHIWVPGSTSPLTLTIRAGPGAGTMAFNGSVSTPKLGGTLGALFSVEEMRP